MAKKDTFGLAPLSDASTSTGETLSLVWRVSNFMRKSYVWIAVLPAVALSSQGCLFLAVRRAVHGHSVGVHIGGSHVTASGPVTQEKRSVGEFTKLAIGSAFTADVNVGPATSVVIEAPKDAMSHITTSLNDGKLEIGIQGSLDINGPLRVHVTTPKLDGLAVSGGSSVTLKGVDANEFDLDVSGAGRLTAAGSVKKLTAELSGAANVTWPNLNMESIDVNASGAAQLRIDGKVETAKIEASGGSLVDAPKLAATNSNVKAQGASRVNIKAETRLSAEASGASSINYSGEARFVDSKTSGASSINHR